MFYTSLPTIDNVWDGELIVPRDLEVVLLAAVVAEGGDSRIVWVDVGRGGLVVDNSADAVASGDDATVEASSCRPQLKAQHTRKYFFFLPSFLLLKLLYTCVLTARC